jgi:hypothetical protein
MTNTRERFYEIVEHLAIHGINPILMHSSVTGKYYFNLQTMAKSDLYLFDDLSVEGRYGYKSKIVEETLEENIRELCYEFANCLCGRDYYSSDWATLCKSLDIKVR